MSKRRLFALAVSMLFAVTILPVSAGASWYWRPESTVPTQPSQPAPQPPEPTEPSSPSQPSTVYPSWYYNRAQYLAPYLDTQPAPAPSPEPTPTPPPAPPQPTQPVPSDASHDETRMLNWINQERAKLGLSPLAMHSTLVQLARLKSQDILDNNYFAHTSPTYGSPFAMIKDAGITYKTAGENLSKARDVATSHMRLMASEGHRQNILNPAFTHVGIGVVPYQYGVVVTQLFIGQ